MFKNVFLMQIIDKVYEQVLDHRIPMASGKLAYASYQFKNNQPAKV